MTTCCDLGLCGPNSVSHYEVPEGCRFPVMVNGESATCRRPVVSVFSSNPREAFYCPLHAPQAYPMQPGEG